MALSRESTQLCSSCEESSAAELLYKCTQCNVSDDPKKPVEFLCDLCVALHIKKKHPILDHRSLEPAVCSEHKQLCLDYCITCDEVSCAKCLVKHSKHEFKPLIEKASEVRAKVFEMLSDWEKNEKTALEKSEDISKIVDVHETEMKQLVKEVESMLEKVKETLTAEIKSKFTEFKATQNWVKDHVRTVGQTQSDLRGLLCQSNGSMVASISTVLAKTVALRTSQSEVELYQMNKEKFQTGAGFKSLHQKIVFEMRKELSLPGLKSKDPEPSLVTKSQTKSKGAKPKLQQKFKLIVGGCFADGCFEVAQTNQSFEVRNYDTQNRKTSPAIVSECGDLVSASVDRVYYCDKHLVVVCSQLRGGGKHAFFCDVRDCDILWTKKTYPSNFDVLGPFRSVNSDLVWLYWDPSEHSIRIWPYSIHWRTYTVQCLSRPVNKYVTDCSLPCFFDRRAQKIIALWPNNESAEILGRHEYNETIDSISSFRDEKHTVVVTWSVEFRASSVYCCRNSHWSEQWTVRARLSWGESKVRIDPSGSLYELNTLNVGDDKKKELLFFIERH